MRRRCRMYDKRLRVSDVGENREDLAVERVRETSGLIGAALDAEDDHSACAVREILLREFRLREGRILDPGDLRVLLEVLCDRERVFAVARDAERQRLDALEEDPRGIRRERRALVADPYREKANRKRDGLKRLREVVCEPEAVVTGVWLVVERELGVGPVEAAFLDHYAADSRAVSADPLRKGVDDEVRAVVKRPQKRRRRKRGVHDERKVVPVRDFRILLYVRDVKGGVADRLDKEKPSLLVYRRFDGPKVVDGGEVHLDARVREDRVELAERAAVEVRGSDNLVASAGDVRDGEEDRRRAGGERLRSRAALERRDALGEDVVRRVHEASVDVAKLPETEEVGPVLGVAEVVGRRPVDRNGACVSRGVAEGRLSCVDCQRFNVEFLVAHVAFSFLSFGREHYRISPSHCIIGNNPPCP